MLIKLVVYVISIWRRRTLLRSLNNREFNRTSGSASEAQPCIDDSDDELKLNGTIYNI